MRTATELKANVLKITKIKFISEPITRTSIPFFIKTCFYEGTKRYGIVASRTSNKAEIKDLWQNLLRISKGIDVILSLAYVILIVYHSIKNEAWDK